jgi:hypothetical protein
MIMTARGIRNNNPGNIRKGQDWQGEAKVQDDASFEVFESPEYGIRAIAKIMLSYNKRNINTVTNVIHTWAPPNENDTTAYINAVAKSIGCAPDAVLDMHDSTVMLKLVKAIITHENGQQPYSDDIILKGINMAFQ